MLLVLAVVISCTVPLTAATIISIVPTAETVDTNTNLILDVNIANVMDLYAYQFAVSFAPGVISGVNVAEGSFLASGGSTFFIPGTIDNVAGTISLTAASLSGPVPGISGSGTLATLEFSTLKPGTSPIVLSNVALLDSSFGIITATQVNGSVNVVPEPTTILLLAAGLVPLFIIRQTHTRKAGRRETGAAYGALPRR